MSTGGGEEQVRPDHAASPRSSCLIRAPNPLTHSARPTCASQHAPPAFCAPPVAPLPLIAMSTQIPTARVNRIIKADKDVRLCSKEAVFLIAKATVSCEAGFGRVFVKD